eukprot:UN28908
MLFNPSTGNRNPPLFLFTFPAPGPIKLLLFSSFFLGGGTALEGGLLNFGFTGGPPIFGGGPFFPRWRSHPINRRLCFCWWWLWGVIFWSAGRRSYTFRSRFWSSKTPWSSWGSDAVLRWRGATRWLLYIIVLTLKFR